MQKHDHGGHGDSCCSSKAAAPSLIKLSEAPTAGARLSSFRIEAMDCPTEQTLIQNKLGKLAGVQQLEFNLINRVLGVTHDLPSTAPIIDAIKSLGMHAEPLEQGAEAPAPAPVKKPWWPLALSGVGALAAEVIHFTSAAPNWVVAVIALVSILSGGLGTYKKGWIALKNLNLNINALMSIAVTGAMLIGQWPEAAMVMFLFTVAELIEAKSLDRARNAISGLMQMTPEQATVQQADGSWIEQDVKTIELGARVRVRPGERIGLDGEVVSGSSTIDQAPITGESLPVEKTVGDKVFAGTINQAGSLEYAVTAAANNSTLARIIHAVEQAQGARAPTQRFVDQFLENLHPGGVHLRPGGGGDPAAVHGRVVVRLDLPRAGAAGGRVPVCAGDFHPGDHRQRPRGGGAQRHSGQGRRVSGGRLQARLPGAGQDRHHHPRQAGADRLPVA